MFEYPTLSSFSPMFEYLYRSSFFSSAGGSTIPKRPIAVIMGFFDNIQQEVGKDGKLCWMKVTREMYQETKSFIEDTEPFIDYLRQIKDVKVLFILKESSENKTKASFRSIGKFDVQKLAKKFGGGGHRNASGATLNEPIDQAEKTILKAIKLWMGY